MNGVIEGESDGVFFSGNKQWTRYEDVCTSDVVLKSRTVF